MNGRNAKTVAKIHRIFERNLFLNNFDTVDIVAASYLANKLPGARLWICLIGPSGCGKTTMAESLLGLPRVWPLDGLTQGTFSSGYRIKDSPERFGLFEKLSDGREHMILIPDFSTILSDQTLRNRMCSQMRRIYDGKWDQSYGTGVKVEWTGSIGLLACATPNFEREIQSEAVFGERFIYWKMPSQDKFAMAERAARNTTRTKEINKQLKKAMLELANIKVPKDEASIPKVPLAIRNALAREVAFAATARTPVIRDRHNREIIDIPVEESPSRLSQQVSQLLRGLMVLYGLDGPTEQLLEVAEVVTFTTIPTNRLRIMGAIGDRELTATRIPQEAKVPKSVATRTVEELYELGLLDSMKGATGSDDQRLRYYRANQQYVAFFKRCKKVLMRLGMD